MSLAIKRNVRGKSVGNSEPKWAELYVPHWGLIGIMQDILVYREGDERVGVIETHVTFEYEQRKDYTYGIL